LGSKNCWFKKNPIDTTKVSKAGRLMLVNFNTVKYDEKLENEDMLELVFDKGELLKDYTFDEIRVNAAL